MSTPPATIITRLWGTGLLMRVHEVSEPGDMRHLVVTPPSFVTDAADPVGSNETDWRRAWPYPPHATTTHAQR